MIALFSSMPFESNLILSCIKGARSREIAGKVVCYGKLGRSAAVLVHTGIGKVNAALSVTFIFENFPVSRVINIGVGGAYPGSGLNIGDVAIATREINADEGVFSSKGIKGMKEIGIPVVRTGGEKYFNEYPLHSPPLPPGVQKKKRDFNIRSGRFTTVSAATGTQQRARQLEKAFRAVCENMEGAAIAQVCTIYNVPMSEMRGISNMTGVRDRRRWNLKLAAENCQEVALAAIGLPG